MYPILFIQNLDPARRDPARLPHPSANCSDRRRPPARSTHPYIPPTRVLDWHRYLTRPTPQHPPLRQLRLGHHRLRCSISFMRLSPRPTRLLDILNPMHSLAMPIPQPLHPSSFIIIILTTTISTNTTLPLPPPPPIRPPRPHPQPLLPLTTSFVLPHRLDFNINPPLHLKPHLLALPFSPDCTRLSAQGLLLLASATVLFSTMPNSIISINRNIHLLSPSPRPISLRSPHTISPTLTQPLNTFSPIKAVLTIPILTMTPSAARSRPFLAPPASPTRPPTH